MNAPVLRNSGNGNASLTASEPRLLRRLFDKIKPLGSVAVGFSGGVDSSVVVAAAAHVLGKDSIIAVTAVSPTLPEIELKEARGLAQSLGIRHVLIETSELDNEEFCANTPDRCFYCKEELWRKVRAVAKSHSIQHLADGLNADDLNDFRPGIKAGDQAGVAHPLVQAGAGKEEVRQMAKKLGLPNWNKPAQACLSSRFPYGERITVFGLGRVEQAERLLKSLGFGQLRVRSHADMARIEIEEDMLELALSNANRKKIYQGLKQLGFTYVTLDLKGFSSGSMNENLGS